MGKRRIKYHYQNDRTGFVRLSYHKDIKQGETEVIFSEYTDISGHKVEKWIPINN